MTEPLILVERDGGIATVTLNRPKALNALSEALGEAGNAILAELAADSDVRVVILTGAGRAFTAGVDLKELGRTTERFRSADADQSDNTVNRRWIASFLLCRL